MLALIRESYAEPPALDTAISRQILDEVATGRRPNTLRLHVPARIVAFGRQDAKASGYREAVAATHAAGFAPVERLAGGRAAVFTEGTLAFAWAQAHPDPRLGIRRRFETIAQLIRDALRSLGVDARIGEIAGEYCPGEFSVNAGGLTKIAGIGQRLIRGAAHVGGVVVIQNSVLVRRTLEPVYEALQLAWDPTTVGAVDDVVAGASIDDATTAILAQFSQHYDLVTASVDDQTRRKAVARIADHQPGTATGRVTQPG